MGVKLQPQPTKTKPAPTGQQEVSSHAYSQVMSFDKITVLVSAIMLCIHIYIFSIYIYIYLIHISIISHYTKSHWYVVIHFSILMQPRKPYLFKMESIKMMSWRTSLDDMCVYVHVTHVYVCVKLRTYDSKFVVRSCLFALTQWMGD